MIRSLLAAVAMTVAAWHPPAFAEEPVWKFDLRSGGDSITVESDAKRRTFVISSGSGIGRATITRVAGEWPEQVTLRLRYTSGRGFCNLERLILRSDRLMIQSDLKHSGRMPFGFHGQNGKPEARNAAPFHPHGLVDVKAILREDGIHVILPSHMLRGSSHLRIEWIDAFRI